TYYLEFTKQVGGEDKYCYVQVTVQKTNEVGDKAGTITLLLKDGDEADIVADAIKATSAAEDPRLDTGEGSVTITWAEDATELKALATAEALGTITVTLEPGKSLVITQGKAAEGTTLYGADADTLATLGGEVTLEANTTKKLVIHVGAGDTTAPEFYAITVTATDGTQQGEAEFHAVSVDVTFGGTTKSVGVTASKDVTFDAISKANVSASTPADKAELSVASSDTGKFKMVVSVDVGEKTEPEVTVWKLDNGVYERKGAFTLAAPTVAGIVVLAAEVETGALEFDVPANPGSSDVYRIAVGDETNSAFYTIQVTVSKASGGNVPGSGGGETPAKSEVDADALSSLFGDVAVFTELPVMEARTSNESTSDMAENIEDLLAEENLELDGSPIFIPMEVMSVDKAGVYVFGIKDQLVKYSIPAGYRLFGFVTNGSGAVKALDFDVSLAAEATPPDTNQVKFVENVAEPKETIDVVPDDQNVAAAANLPVGKAYVTIAGAKAKVQSGPTSNNGSGGCDLGLGGVALLLAALLPLAKKR
ncbi:MAG: hypothetical protein IJ702_05945, partial [Fretibacterium sp.]|nr:hypothetical protein [Fretibacterium sp.]